MVKEVGTKYSLKIITSNQREIRSSNSSNYYGIDYLESTALLDGIEKIKEFIPDTIKVNVEDIKEIASFPTKRYSSTMNGVNVHFDAMKYGKLYYLVGSLCLVNYDPTKEIMDDSVFSFLDKAIYPVHSKIVTHLIKYDYKMFRILEKSGILLKVDIFSYEEHSFYWSMDDIRDTPSSKLSMEDKKNFDEFYKFFFENDATNEEHREAQVERLVGESKEMNITPSEYMEGVLDVVKTFE